MPIRIFAVYKSIIINKIFFTSIVRRIYVDYINFSGVGVGQFGKGREIVSLDYNVVRCLGVI